MRLFFLTAFLSACCFGQFTESLVLPNTKTATNASIPATSGLCYEEGLIHNVPGTIGATAFEITNPSCGFNLVLFVGTPGQVGAYWTQGNAGTGPCVGNYILYTIPSGVFYYRLQKSDAAKTFSFELWDQNGVYQTSNFTNNQCTFLTLSGSYSNGQTIGSGFTGPSYDVAFDRAFALNVPLNSQMPVTAAPSLTGCIYEWKFDNNLNDTCSGAGSGTYPATVSAPAYVSTGALQNLVVSRPQVASTPFVGSQARPTYSDWIALKVGATNTLEGGASFSQAAASSFVTYVWSQTGGAGSSLAGTTSQNPTVVPPSFGSYSYQLAVTDANSNTATATLALGAVSMDVNGVVTVPNGANSDQAHVLGPLIAFGQNPWSFADQKNQFAIYQMAPTTHCATCGNWYLSHYDTTWETLNASGTISYKWSGTGLNPAAACAKLTGAITSTSTSIAIDRAECLDLSTLPTQIYVGTDADSNNYELVRISATTATSGAATLTVAYDGRGLSGNQNQAPHPGPANSWGINTPVGQLKITGTSTKFVTDANRPVCPAGAPGPPGPVIYNTGTVTITASSTTVSISGGTFTSAMVNGFIRVNATHNGGTAFTFWRQIMSLTDSTHIVVDHAPDASFDTGSYSFQITQPIFLMLQANSVTDGHVFNTLFNGMGCESETAMYSVPAHDNPPYNAITMPTTGTLGYSYKLSTWYSASGTTTPDFYGVGLAALLYYYRSGDQVALDLSNIINPYITRDPEMADGIAPTGNQVLVYGGPVIGTMACLVTGDCPSLALQNLNGATNPWLQVEPFAIQGEIGGAACSANDTRTSGYLSTWLTMAANWDSDAAKRTAFNAALQTLSTSDSTCQRTTGDGYPASEAGSFANSFVFNPAGNGGGPVTLTNGSKTMTGTGLTNWTTSTSGNTPLTCFGLDEGTITVTNGSSSATIATVTTNGGVMTAQTTGTWQGVSPNLIWLSDGANDWVAAYSFSGTSLTFGGKYTGTSGTFSFMTTGGGDPSSGNGSGFTGGLGYGAIAVDNTDNLANNHMLRQAWACRTTSSTTANLFKPWPYATGSTYQYSYYNIGSFSQQPFFLGIKSIQINWAQYNANSTVVSNYQAIAANVGNWYNTYGWDSLYTRATAYNTINTACGSVTDQPTASPTFQSIHGYEGCAPFSADPTNISIARTDSAEGGNAMPLYYSANVGAPAKAAVDSFYGAIFGAPGTCAASVASTCDGLYAQQLDTLSANKWPGFFFGVGGLFSNAWPAIRAGTSTAGGSTVSGGISIGGNVSIQ